MKKVCIASSVLLILALSTIPGRRIEKVPRLSPPQAPPPSAHGLTVSPDTRTAAEDLLARRNDLVRRLANPATGLIPRDIRRRELDFASALPRRPAADKALTWESRGPANVGGRTRALALDVSDPGFNTILAGGISGGMWRSTDAGAHWTLTTGSLQQHHVSSLAQDTRPGRGNIWYYGTGEGEGGSAAWPLNGAGVFAGDGVYKSTDGGTSWAVLPATAGADPQTFSSLWQVVWKLAIDPSNLLQDEVYAATWGGIQRSTDGGGTWSLVLGSAISPAGYTDLAVSATGVVYATISYDGAQHGVYRSADGLVWTEITPPGAVDYDRITIAVAPGNENIVWFLSANTWNQPDAALYRYQYLTGDGSGTGGLWSDRSALLANLPGIYGPSFFETQGSYCQMVAVSPSDPETVYLGGVNLYRSTDGFQSAGNVSLIGGWGYPDQHADQHVLVFQPGSAAVAYTGSDGGVHRTLDAGAPFVVWTPVNQGYQTSQFYTVAIDENTLTSPVVIGGTQDNGSLIKPRNLPGTNWQNVLGADGGYCAVATSRGLDGVYYVSYQQNFGIFRLQLDNDSGALVMSTRVDPPAADTSLWLKPYILDPLDPTLMIMAADRDVWRNSDLDAIPAGNADQTGINWAVLTQAASGQMVSALAMSRSPAHTLWFGTAAGQLYRLDGADTAAAGSTAQRLDIGAGFPAGAYVSSIAIHPSDDQRLLLAFSNYSVVNIFSSPDGGATWTAVEGNLGGADSPSIRSVVWLPKGATDYCLAGTSTGIYSTTNLAGPATVWQQEASGLVGNLVVDMLAARVVDGVVVAATHGQGVVRGSLGASPVPDADSPRIVQLQRNVPNPFNPSTRIRFHTSRSGHVSLVIYDTAGHHIRTLAAGFRSAGDHEVGWDGSDDSGRPVASGTYLYRLRGFGRVETKAMTLLR